MAGTITAGIRLVSIADTSGFKRFQSSVRDLRLEFLGFEQIGAVLQRAGQAVLRFGQLAGRGVVAAVREAVELDDIMTQISAVAGPRLETTVDDLRDGFLRISNELPLTATTLGEVGVAAARAGISTQEGIEAVALVSGKLAAIGDSLSEAKAAEALITISNNMQGVSDRSADMARNVEYLGDRLARLENIGIATAGQIAEIAIRASGAAKSINLTQAELLAFATAVRNTGSSTEVAGTAMANMFARIAGNVDKASAAAGQNADEIKGLLDQGRGLEAIRKIIHGLAFEADGSRRSTTDMFEAMKRAGFGGRRLGNVVALLAQNMGALDEAVAAAADSVGELDAKFRVASESIQKKIDTLVGSVQNVAASFGITLKPIINTVIDALLVLTGILIAIPAPVKMAIVVLAALGAGLTLLAGGIITIAALFLSSAAALLFLYQSVRKAKEEYKKFAEAVKIAADIQRDELLIAQLRAKWMRGPDRLPLTAASTRATPALRMRRDAQERIRLLKQQADAIGGIDATTRGLASSALRADTAFGKLLKKLFNIRDASPMLAPILGSTPTTTTTTVGAAGGGAGAGAAGSTLGAYLTAGGLSAAATVGIIVAGIAVLVATLSLMREEVGALFNAFIGVFTPFVDAWERLSGMFANTETQLGGLVTAFIKIGFFLSPIGGLFLTIYLGLRLLSAAISAVLGFLLDFFEPFITTIVRSIDGIGRLVTWLGNLAASFGLVAEEGSILDAVFSGIEWLFSGILYLFGLFAKVILPLGLLFDFVMGIIMGFFEGVARAARPFFTDLQEAFAEFSAAWDDIVAAFQPLVDAFSELGTALGFAGEGFDFFGVMVQLVAFLTRAVLIPVFTALRFGIRVLVGLFRGLVIVMSPIIKMFKAVVAVISTAVNAVRDLWNAVMGDTSISGALKNLFAGLGDVYQDAMDKFLYFVDAVRAIPRFFRWAYDWAVRLFNLIPGVSLGANAAVSDTGSPTASSTGAALIARQVGASVISFVGSLLGLASGGITRNDMVARVHADEAVIPLDELPTVMSRRAVGSTAEPVEQAASTARGGDIVITVPVMLDGMQLGRAVARSAKSSCGTASGPGPSGCPGSEVKRAAE